MLQLANVPRPVVLLQLLHTRQGQPGRRPAQSTSDLFDKVCGQQRNILFAASQWGDLDREHTQSIVQIVPEAARLGLFTETAIGRRDDANIDLSGALFADALQLSLLQDAQQLALQVQWNLGHFIEKQRAAAGQFKAADALPVRARERSLGVTKELALKKLPGNGRAIDRDEQLAGALAPAMDFTSDQFLARPAFAEDHGGRVGFGNEFDLRGLLTRDATIWQYTHGVRNKEAISPDNWNIDQPLLDRPGNNEIQLDLFLSYGTNPPHYKSWQEYFRKHQPPTLIVWGENDQIFPAAGAEPYKRDLKKLEFHLLDTGHFALEEDGAQIARLILGFLDRNVKAVNK